MLGLVEFVRLEHALCIRSHYTDSVHVRHLISLLVLRYPFNISKSNLHSVGSPHAWPIILGALCWLIELIRVCVCIHLIQ